MKILELFGGIGACSKALERLGIDYEIADYVEIDKYAVKSFNAIHGTNFMPQDIREWDKNIKVDLIMHGSPCQDFSIAGKQAGGDKNSGTRSSLMYETLRIVEKLQPKYVIWENVKNLLSEKHCHNLGVYLDKMTKLGYYNNYQVLNAKDYGIPQNRERVFTISIRDDLPNRVFKFPNKQPLTKRLKDVLEPIVDERYYLDKKLSDGPLKSENSENIRVVGKLDMAGMDIIKRVYDTQSIAPTLSTMTGGHRQPKIIEDFYKSRNPRVYGEVAPTLRSERSGLKVAEPTVLIRKLTPKECWRLMGFDDEDFEKAAKVNSNAQLYKQAGNSIVVNVLEAILGNLLENERG